MKPAAMSLALKPLKSLKNKFKDLEIKKFENKKRELLLLPPSPTARYVIALDVSIKILFLG